MEFVPIFHLNGVIVVGWLVPPEGVRGTHLGWYRPGGEWCSLRWGIEDPGLYEQYVTLRELQAM